MMSMMSSDLCIDLGMLFKCLKGMAPTYISDQFSQRNSVHKYVTRGRNELNVPSF